MTIHVGGVVQRRVHAARPASLIACTIALSALAACGGESVAAEARDVVVRDSAGISIVESGVAPSRPALELDSVPTLDIGERDDDDPDYQLFQVRGVVRRQDGGVIVINGGASELRMYDAAGAFVRRIGRKGQGPGEFEELQWVRLGAADTVVAYDWSGRRLSRFAPDGEYAGSVVLGGATSGEFLFPVGLLGDGGIVATGSAMFIAGQNPDGLSRDSTTLFGFNPAGELRDTLLRTIGTERLMISQGGGFSVTSPLFGRMTSMSAAGNTVSVATADSYEIRLHDGDGVLRRIVRRRVDPVPVTERDVEALKAERMEGATTENDRRRVQGQFDAMTLPPVMPPYTNVLVDRVARLWVRESAPIGSAAKWAVYDAEGGLATELRFPARFRIMEAGDGYVLGVLRDENDLERVQLYRLRTPDGDA